MDAALHGQTHSQKTNNKKRNRDSESGDSYSRDPRLSDPFPSTVNAALSQTDAHTQEGYKDETEQRYLSEHQTQHCTDKHMIDCM